MVGGTSWDPSSQTAVPRVQPPAVAPVMAKRLGHCPSPPPEDLDWVPGSWLCQVRFCHYRDLKEELGKESSLLVSVFHLSNIVRIKLKHKHANLNSDFFLKLHLSFLFRPGELCAKREITVPTGKSNWNITISDYIHVSAFSMEKISALQR